MKKALISQYSNGINYVAGESYEDSDVAHLPESDFETVTKKASSRKPKAEDKKPDETTEENKPSDDDKKPEDQDEDKKPADTAPKK